MCGSVCGNGVGVRGGAGRHVDCVWLCGVRDRIGGEVVVRNVYERNSVQRCLFITQQAT